ncbi:helix-turn-helix domain-containing protein [Shewanella algae]|uniref:helix-turn-helix domain-containing protein n=1 Tax=Shewanella algae TaxID=38313 RepID=UPI00280C24D9|nr:helix-turn-helix transcriptional regulator [Shewanella algae]
MQLHEKGRFRMAKAAAASGAKLLAMGRRLRQMTQEEVASAYGVNVKTYRRWEKGQSPVPYDDLCAICADIFALDLFNLRGIADAA